MNRKFLQTSIALAASCFSLLAGATVVRNAEADVNLNNVQMVPSGKGYGVPAADGRLVVPMIAGNGIDYHGGPVMKSAKGVNIYVIWYGDWATQSPTGKTIVNDLFNSVGGTPYYNINTTYYQKKDVAKNKVKNKVTLKGQIDDAGKSLGSALTDANIKTLVSNAITSGALPSDKNGLYFVLTTKDVNETSGFCTQYCGWHTHGSVSGVDIKYSFVGDAARCINSCAIQSKGPNDNAGVDGMASVIVHELEEAATDPDLNAWWSNAQGGENADLCAWTFGTTHTAPNGALYNVTWGSRNYLIQQNWVNASGGKCALQYP